jgi:hypothetical protein
MKNILQFSSFIQLATLSVLMTLASSGQADERIRFRGTIEGAETQSIDFPKMQVTGAAIASAKALGKLSVITHHDVFLITGVGVGSAVFEAGNGDKLYTSIHAVGIPTGVGSAFRVTEYHTILDGTGRFAVATGSFKLVRLIDSTLSWSGTFEGTILLGKGIGDDKD